MSIEFWVERCGGWNLMKHKSPKPGRSCERGEGGKWYLCKLNYRVWFFEIPMNDPKLSLRLRFRPPSRIVPLNVDRVGDAMVGIDFARQINHLRRVTAKVMKTMAAMDERRFVSRSLFWLECRPRRVLLRLLSNIWEPRRETFTCCWCYCCHWEGYEKKDRLSFLHNLGYWVADNRCSWNIGGKYVSFFLAVIWFMSWVVWSCIMSSF